MKFLSTRRFLAYLPAILLSIAAMPLAHGRDVANCADTDPANYEDVYRCISSYRWKDGRSVFEASFSRSATPCWELATIYAGALSLSGTSANLADRRTRAEGLKHMPSCRMLAKAREDWTGKPPSWAGCLDYDADNIEAHMQACLTGYLRGLKGRDREEFGSREAVSHLPDCETALNTYERALEHAMPYRAQPQGYARPDCAVVGRALTAMQLPPGAEEGDSAIAAQWGACLDYDPDNMAAHMEGCMEGHTAGIADCASLIRSYEQRLHAAYGGSFPVDYIRPKCFDAEDIVNAQRIAAAELQRQREELRRNMQESQPESRPPTAEEIGAALVVGGRELSRNAIFVLKRGRKIGGKILWGATMELLSGD